MSVFNEPRRTNNAVESFHKGLRNKIKTPGPGFYKFIGEKNYFLNLLCTFLFLKTSHTTLVDIFND